MTLARLEEHGRTLVVVNANASKRGALSPDLYRVINEALTRANDTHIRAIILASEGGFFCSGGDLNTLKERSSLSLEERRAKVQELHDLIAGLRACPVPVIAAVEGGAAGAGLSLALACDMLIAAEGAQFTASYVKAGVVPDAGLTSALARLADADYAAACAQAGIMGFITAASFPDPRDLKAEIAKAHRLCGDKPFGVNVSMLPKLVPGEKSEEVFRLIAGEGVEAIETSGRNPESYMDLLKGQGSFVIHKVPSVRFAEKAQSIGVDMVSIVGAECGGHPGLDLIGTMVNNALALERLQIPFLIGGGIGHGAQIAAALAMGASGVVMGSKQGHAVGGARVGSDRQD